MDSRILREANLKIRKKRPFFSDKKICDVFYSNNLVEIGFLSRRCHNDLHGACIMCDYGASQKCYTPSEYIREMDRIMNGLDQSVNTLLLCTNGSFLDETQISPTLFRMILERAGQSRIQTIEIETHYRDVTIEKLRLMYQLLPGKRIMVEMGLETVNAQYQSCIIMKDIDLVAYAQTISLIQSVGFQVETNIMVGLPFLSAKEQFKDALSTIQWAYAHHCSMVLFPMNIKPYTLLMDMYHTGHYQPISQWMLPLILHTLTEAQLERTTVAWYGNREEIYSLDGERAVFPQACPACTAAVREFYQQFLTAHMGNERKILLNQLLSQQKCVCLQRAQMEIAEDLGNDFEGRYTAYIFQLQQYGL